MHTRNFYRCFFFLRSVCLLRSLRTSTRMTSTHTYCRNLTTQQISCHSQSLEPQKPLYRYMCVFFSLPLSPHLIFFFFLLSSFIYICFSFIIPSLFLPGSSFCRSLVRWHMWTLYPQCLCTCYWEQPALHLSRGNTLSVTLPKAFASDS